MKVYAYNALRNDALREAEFIPWIVPIAEVLGDVFESVEV